jgi:hypothetical protein
VTPTVLGVGELLGPGVGVEVALSPPPQAVITATMTNTTNDMISNGERIDLPLAGDAAWCRRGRLVQLSQVTPYNVNEEDARVRTLG